MPSRVMLDMDGEVNGEGSIAIGANPSVDFVPVGVQLKTPDIHFRREGG